MVGTIARAIAKAFKKSGFQMVRFQIPTVPNFLKFGIQMVQNSNGSVFKRSVYGLCPMYILDQPFEYVLDQYIRKQDFVHLLGIQMVGLFGIQMAFENQTIWHPTSFPPFEFQKHLKTELFEARISNGLDFKHGLSGTSYVLD